MKHHVVAIIGIVLSTVQISNAVMHSPPKGFVVRPNSYLFQFSGQPGTPEALQQVQEFNINVQNLKSVTIRHSFHNVINGVSAEVMDDKELQHILNMPTLEMVTPLTVVSPPEQAKTDTNVLITAAHHMTGVDRVHDELKLTGANIKVGIIDSGVDYTHPALGGCFGSNCRVAYGYDFVGNAFDGNNDPIPGPAPMDCAGHGTHVAGIVAGNDDVIKGVAPQAILGAYRVLGCNGTTSNDLILAGLERAVADKMDIINLSLGEPDGWPANPVAKAIANAGKLHNIYMIAAQGNEATDGLFSANYVGEGSNVMAVASTVNALSLSYYFTLGGAQDPKYSYSIADTPFVNFNNTVFMVGLKNGTTFGTACEPLPANSLKNKVVVAIRGGCLFAKKAQNALDAGAVGIVFTGNSPELFVPTVGSVPIQACAVTQEVGQQLQARLWAIQDDSSSPSSSAIFSGSIEVKFSGAQASVVNKAAGTISDFSSIGLDNELHIKPDIAAPGENIYSTWIVSKGKYQVLSGTSMASPYVAGAIALWIERSKQFSNVVSSTNVQYAIDTFKNTAVPTFAQSKSVPPGVSGLVDSVARQGAGMINVYRALTTGILDSSSTLQGSTVTPSRLELNDTAFGQPNQSLTIENRSSQPQTYTFSHLPAEAIRQANATTVDNQAADATVTLPNPITIEPHSKKTVTVEIRSPISLPQDQQWLYSGFIVITPSSSSSSMMEPVHVPYGGLSGYMNAIPILAKQDSSNSKYQACQVLGAGVANKQDYIYTMQGTDFPIVSFCVQNPTNFLVLDVIRARKDSLEHQPKYPPTFYDPKVPRLPLKDPLYEGENGSGGNSTVFVGRFAASALVEKSSITSPSVAISWDGFVDQKKKDTESSKSSGEKSITNMELNKNNKIDMEEPGSSGRSTVNAKRYELLSNSVLETATSTVLKEVVQAPIVQARGMRANDKRQYVPNLAGLLNGGANNGCWLSGLVSGRAGLCIGARGREGSDVTVENQVGTTVGISAKGSENSVEAIGTVTEMKRDLDPKSGSTNTGIDELENLSDATNRVQVPNGMYQFVLKALRLFGDITRDEDYDIWISRPFEVRRTAASTPVAAPAA